MSEELRIVKREYAGKMGVTTMMFAWLGLGSTKNGPWRYIFNDGYVFQQHPLNRTVPGHYYISRGCSDVTGAKFDKYLRLVFEYENRTGAKAYKPGRSVSLNALELDTGGNFGIDGKSRFESYRGGLYDDPNEWSEPYKSWYLDSHPEARNPA